jgi:ribosomal protein S7
MELRDKLKITHNTYSIFSHTTFYKKLLGLLVKKGKKTVSKRILDKAFLETAATVNLPLHLVFIKIFLKLNSFVETKKVKVRRTSHIVPWGTTFERRSYLAAKWLLDIVKQDKRKVSTSKKLSKELINILQDEMTSRVVTKKIQNMSQAVSNRSNIHYRW